VPERPADRPRISAAARRDLQDIWLHGAERWSIRQADAYANTLFDLLELIDRQPRMGALRADLRPPVRVHPHRAHVVVYRETADGPEILRILDARRDWRALLGD